MVEPNMINPKFHEYIKQNRRQMSPQLTLVYNAENILLTTEMVRFYMDHHMEICNIRYCIEFTRDKPLKNFVETVTKKRIKATHEKKDSLQLLYKLVANSSYGR